MGFDVYLNPDFKGPFTGLPTSSRVMSLGRNPVVGINANGFYQRYYDINRTLPCYAFTTAVPTTTTVETYSQTFLCGANTYEAFCFPVCLGFLKIDIARTMTTTQLLANAVSGGDPRWQVEYRSRSTFSKQVGGTSAGTGQLKPMVAYIWRPSTNALVGGLWQSTADPQGNATGLAVSAVVGSNWKWERDSGVYGIGYGSSNGWGMHVQTYNWTSVAIQSGDVMVVEYWAQVMGGGFFSIVPNTVNVDMFIGGATVQTGNGAGSEVTPIHATTIPFPSETSATLPTSVPSLVAGPAIPSLTQVNPRAGKGLGLVFDNPVGITGPTLGSPVDGIGLPPGGVTQSDTTHIDIDIDIPPTHPLGTAEDITVEPPTGGGATVL